MDTSQLLFSSRIVSVDSYMAEPVAGLDLEKSEFRKSDVKSVPVIRVFGSTPAGQTTCLHVHGVFPYLMIPYTGPDIVDVHWSEIEAYMHLLAAGLDEALISTSGKSKSNRQHVFKVVLLRGIPFYGYHEEEELFLKVYFYFPGDIKRAAELLQNGMVLDRSFQVHEAHIPYILQYFLDYNLYGMNLLHAKNCWFRLPIGKPDPISELPIIQRPDDVPIDKKGNIVKEDMGKTEREHVKSSEEKLQVPTMSQFRSFDWNLLREKKQSGQSQNKELLDHEGEFVNLSLDKSNVTTATQSNESSRHSSQSYSCSDLCKSVISRTLTPDSTLVNSPESRRPVSCPLHTLWTSTVVPHNAKLPANVARYSTCDIEVDVLAADIANRYELSGCSTSNPGIEAIWEDERSRRRERNEDSQIALDQSQPRVIPENLSERESRFFQVLYDSLDQYKEDNSIRSFSESPSFSASLSSRKLSSSPPHSHAESKDLFTSSAETVVNNDDIVSSGGSTIPIGTPSVKSSASLQMKGTQLVDLSGLEHDASTLEFLRQLEQRDSLERSVASQHGNGPFDEDPEQLDQEECIRSQNRKMRELSQSFNASPNNQLIDTFSDATQPLTAPSGDDEDAIENFEMSQRWDSAIQDLLKDLSATEILDFTDPDCENDVIPQLDGTSDESPKGATVISSRSIGVTKSLSVTHSKSHELHCTQESAADLVKKTMKSWNENEKRKNSDDQNERMDVASAFEIKEDEQCGENVDKNASSSSESKLCTEKTMPLTIDLKNHTHFNTKHNLPLQNTSTTILEKDESAEFDKGSTIKIFETDTCSPENGEKPISQEIPEANLNPNSGAAEIKEDEQSSKSVDVNRVSSLDTSSDSSGVTLMKRQGDARTNVFTQLLDENPGVTLYDNTKLCKFTHTAVINLDQMSETTDSDKRPISTLDGSLIKITSVPIDEKNSGGQQKCKILKKTRKSKNRAKTNEVIRKEIAKPSRVRRPRSASKNSYLEDPLFETVFNSDFESDGEGVANAASGLSYSTANKRNRSKKSNDAKKKRQRVVTKWIIVNRFKGVSSMRVGLWRIPDVKRVKLTSELLRWYELYSPRNVDIVVKPTRPPFIHPPRKPRPMGRRSKHMLASLCLFGPLPPRSGLSSFVESPKESENSKGEGSSTLQDKAASSDEDKVTQNSSDSDPPTAAFQRDLRINLDSDGGDKRISGFKKLNILPPSGAIMPNDENQNMKTVKTDSPILERMAFDLLRIEGDLMDQTAKDSEITEITEIQPCKKDVDSFKQKQEFDCTHNDRNKKDGVTMSTQNEFTKSDEATFLSLKIPCTSNAAISSTKKQETAIDWEVGGLHPAGSGVHFNEQHKGGCKSVEPTCESRKATIVSAEDSNQVSIINTGIDMEASKSAHVVQVEKKSQECLKTPAELDKAKGFDSCISVTTGNPDSLVLKELSVKLYKSVSRISHDGAGKEKHRDKMIETQKNCKTDKISTSKRADYEKTIKKKNVKAKKEAKKRKLIEKTERDAPSRHDTDRETKVPKSIVPVASRTVQPLCNRISPVFELENNSDATKTQTIDLVEIKESEIDDSINKPSIKKLKNNAVDGKDIERTTMKVTIENLESTIVAKSGNHEKRNIASTTVTTTRKIFTPSKKVTRNSVTVKLNSIISPTTMFTAASDDSCDVFPPLNALMNIAFPPSPVRHIKVDDDPPRPWTPMRSKICDPPVQENSENDILEELAESFGAGATKMFDLVDESLFKNMDCIEQLIADHGNPSEDAKDEIEKTDACPKDKNETLLEHFDKIFEDVTSNGSTNVSASGAGAHSSHHFDEFEEETLMEFIDEMTSPTQLGNSNSSQMTEFPIPAQTPMEGNEVVRNAEAIARKQSLPEIPFRMTEHAENTPQRPHSTLPRPNKPTRNDLRQQQVGNEKWHLSTVPDRPQSCYPGQSLPNVTQIQRPQSTMPHWNKEISPSQTVVFNNSPMMEIQNNLSSPNKFAYDSQNLCFDPQNKATYFTSPRATSKPNPHRPNYPYSFNQYYPDPGAMPRPNSVMETPLQVFHTHVHHHHHVHSIKNSNPGGGLAGVQESLATSDNKAKHPFYHGKDVKADVIHNVKIEKVANPSWPESVDPTQGEIQKQRVKSKKKPQFCVANSPFPFPKSKQQDDAQSSSLVQTLNYVDTNLSQNRFDTNSDFYKFAGLDPKAQGIVQSSVILPHGPSYDEVPSILLKGTCQWLGAWKKNIGKISKSKPKNTPKVKSTKRKPKLNSNLNQSSQEAVTLDPAASSAKTPYGVMKQNALKRQKDHAPKSVEHKRKSISNFRAPPDTPTISLSGWTASEVKSDTQSFELSQDTFDSPVDPKGEEHKICFNDGKSSNEIPEISPIATDLDPNPRPTPRLGEELILNSATGQWEVVPTDSQKSDDESRLHFPSPGKLPTLPDISERFRKRTIGKFSDLSSDEDFSSSKKKKNLKTGSVKIAYSTPEYMVSSVDLQSDSPRLKLTLKKTPTSRGKPKLSSLSTSSDTGLVLNHPSNENQTLDGTDMSVNSALKIMRQNTTSGDADKSELRKSDDEICDSDATDDASEVGSIIDETSTCFDDHLKSVANMHEIKSRPWQVPLSVTMDEVHVNNALITLSDATSCTKEKILLAPGKSKLTSAASRKQNFSQDSSNDDASGCKISSNDSADTGTESTINKESFSQSNDSIVIKQLVQDCCDKVATFKSYAPIDDHTPIPTAADNVRTCAGQSTEGGNPKKDDKDKKKTSSKEKDIPTSSNNIEDDFDPPSPPENKKMLRKYSLPGFDDVNHVYATSRKPPSSSQVMRDLIETGQASDLSSEEPFYGDVNDAHSASNRLSNLPPYVKKPKPQKTISELTEHTTMLPLEGGIHHWIVMATAKNNYTDIDNSVMRKTASAILPENVHVWDHIDAASKLSQYPLLSKVFLQESNDILLRPAILPPTRWDVQKWIDSKKEMKLSKKIAERTDVKVIFGDFGCSKKNISTEHEACVTPKSLLRRSSSFSSPSKSKTAPRPRRVSFHVLTQSEDDKKSNKKCGHSITTLDSVKGSPNKDAVKKVLKSTQAVNSPGLPFCTALSPVTPNVDHQHTKSPVHAAELCRDMLSASRDNNSGASKTLVDTSDQENSSSLTLLLPGSFTPISKVMKDSSFSTQYDASMKKQPQSTPNTARSRSGRAHKKLSYTTSGQDSSDVRAVSPISVKLHQTPSSKKTNLRKTMLVKKFSKQGDDVTSSDVMETIKSHDSNLYKSSPLSLNSPTQSQKKEGSQIDGPTLDNTYGFKAVQQHLGDAKSLHVIQHITILCLELHVKTRIDLRPDPDMDEIRCLFYCLESDSWTGSEKGMRTGVIVVDPDSTKKGDFLSPSAPSTSTTMDFEDRVRGLLKKSGVTSVNASYVNNEMELFLLFAQLMHQWDPDILVGYEVQMLSWGFLLQRAAHLRCDLCRAISRVPADEQRNKHDALNDAYGADNASELHIVGRVVLNLWRLMRTELALYDYTFESVAFHLLHERHPRYDHKTLTNWFDPPLKSGVVNHCHRWRVIEYYVCRVRGSMRLLTQQDFIGRTSELARVFGIQFYEVLTRGSQFRVESMLLRTARAHNLVAVTPSVLQRAQMRAPEVIALVMEPESKFYRVPVLVLDFQSLYPSMVIAYNICYSTCLGRVEQLGTDAIFTFGCTSLRVPAKTLHKLLRKNQIMINPSGVAFVKSEVRRGVMPKMLDEILTTRIMVKNSMKKLRPDEAATKRVLDHRQLGLKFIANFTYGYTAANFSGRMPCVEVGDSIVHKARETLERAIRLVTRSSQKWENARVVYGDTDSMFIALEGINNVGCSKSRAFEVGREIAAAVTADNPTPVKLRFEKVYLPCVLQTKKRYVGYAFESEDQKDPIFDAKGIETVRRDGTPATAKILEKTLKILFDTRDVSKVKQYVLNQCSKLLDGRTTLKDCIIAKEYRGKQYYRPGAVVPALNIARKLIAMDRRAEPRVGERVPYVIVHGAPGMALYQLVKSPLDVLKDPALQLNGAYYVTKQVLPALDRVLSLLGVDVFLWHRYLPRTVHLSHSTALDDSQPGTSKKACVYFAEADQSFVRNSGEIFGQLTIATISQFFKSKHCLACKSLSVESICEACRESAEARQSTAVTLMMEAKLLERRKHQINKVCMQCSGAQSSSEIRCVSLDCSILYKSFRATYDSSKVKLLKKALQNHDLL